MGNKSKLLILILTFFAILIGVKFYPLVNNKPTAVVVVKDLETQYWELVKAGAEKGFRDFGIKGKVVAPRFEDVESQKELLKGVLNEKPDLLIVSPLNSEVVPALEKFNMNNIPVLLLDTDDAWGNKTAFIGTNNIELGRMGGMLLASQLQPGNEVALISGDFTHSISGDRVIGAKHSLKAAGIKIATETSNLPNDSKDVKDVMEKILLDYPQIKGVFADTDIKALGVIEALGEHNLNIPVIGADGINEMIELIEEGMLSGTVAQNPYDMGYISVEVAMKVLSGETVERNIDTGVDIIIKGNATQRLAFQRELLR
ncbi:sugar ABC transporter substrate-binding protein [Anaerobacillus alkalidiazotrophicus]|uniref:sugar ABC transporter substrate-binding protein n=1 Tax=Anaerobacillus alkalidiazotrophicus TaxID=472963 RepID=UPI00147190DB|nr:sugar ABC transporter substrate-binding protein [Anaerobacillus alkalidiazotrophicus]